MHRNDCLHGCHPTSVQLTLSLQSLRRKLDMFLKPVKVSTSAPSTPERSNKCSTRRKTFVCREMFPHPSDLFLRHIIVCAEQERWRPIALGSTMRRLNREDRSEVCSGEDGCKNGSNPAGLWHRSSRACWSSISFCNLMQPGQALLKRFRKRIHQQRLNSSGGS